MLGWLGVVVLHDQKRHSFCLVVTSGKVAVHQDIWHCVLVVGDPAVRRVFAASDTHGARTEWHMGRSCMARSAAVGSRGSRDGFAVRASSSSLPRFPPTHWLVQGDCVRACIPYLALHFVLLFDANCSSSPTGHRTWMDATLTPSGPEKKRSTRCGPHSQDIDASSPPERHLQSSQS